METATQARERDMRQDRRRHEAQAIGHAIFAEIRDLLPREVEGKVHERLLAALHRNGVLLVRDDERAKLGLESCDQLGWTPSEQAWFMQEKATAMMRMASSPIVGCDFAAGPDETTLQILDMQRRLVLEVHRVTGLPSTHLGETEKSKCID